MRRRCSRGRWPARRSAWCSRSSRRRWSAGTIASSADDTDDTDTGRPGCRPVAASLREAHPRPSRRERHLSVARRHAAACRRRPAGLSRVPGERAMKVGIFVTNQNPLGTDMVSALDEQFAMTRLARDRGWDAVGTGQHYLSEGMSQLQLIPFLGRLAAEAGEMTGVAGVLLINLHNPVEVAECIASLDVIWRGNFVFGVGLGYREA